MLADLSSEIRSTLAARWEWPTNTLVRVTKPVHTGEWGIVMDLAYWGLERQPFRVVPSLDAYYPATSHERVYADLSDALEAGDGIAYLTGETGLGKSLLAHRLVESMQSRYETSYIASLRLHSSQDLWQALLFDFALPHDGSESILRLRFIEACLKTFQEDKRTLLVIDEAQQLSGELIEELRLLTNLEGRRGKAVQVILVGERDLQHRLKTDRLALSNRRYGLHAKLEPLTNEESFDYLKHQIRFAGGRPDRILDEEAAEVLVQATSGIPLRLNRAAYQSMILAERSEIRQIDVEVALESLSRLGLSVLQHRDVSLSGNESILKNLEPERSLKIAAEELLPEPTPFPLSIHEELSVMPMLSPLDRPRPAAKEIREDGSTVLIYSGESEPDDRVIDEATAAAMLKQSAPLLRHAN
jgi:general secretion pathway protein A